MRSFLATVVGAALAIAALAPTAAAVEPIREDFSFSGTAVLADVCPFPVTAQLTGTVTETVFFDREGNVTRVHDHVVEQDVFTANGKTLVGLPFTFNFQVLIDPETGEATNVFASGVFERVPLPGGGFFLTAGRADFIASGESFLIQPDVERKEISRASAPRWRRSEGSPKNGAGAGDPGPVSRGVPRRTSGSVRVKAGRKLTPLRRLEADPPLWFLWGCASRRSRQDLARGY